LLDRTRVRSLERRLHSGYGRIPLKDGTIYRYHAKRAGEELWCYCIGLLRVTEDDPMPPEPEILQKIRAARNPKQAMRPFRPADPSKALIDPGVLLEDDGGWPPTDAAPDLSETPENPF
jgi:hypothetical protein